MSPIPTLLLTLTLTLLSSAAIADPDPFLDFCIPDPGSSNAPLQLTHLLTYPCKSPFNLTAADFSFSGLRNASPHVSPNGFSGTFATPLVFPALHTLGLSVARADLVHGGFNVPHYHPRATEMAMVIKGTVYAGFVDSGNRVFAKVLEEGDVWINPRGMVHFLMNVGEGTATVMGFFNSENAGGVQLPEAVFGSGINEELLQKAFELSEEEIERLKERFGSRRSEVKNY